MPGRRHLHSLGILWLLCLLIRLLLLDPHERWRLRLGMCGAALETIIRPEIMLATAVLVAPCSVVLLWLLWVELAIMLPILLAHLALRYLSS